MEDEEFVNPNFIVTQKINQIGKVLNDLKEKQSDILINNHINSSNTPDYVKLELIKQNAIQDARNYTEQIKLIQEENKNRILFLKKPISSLRYQAENEKKHKPPHHSQQKLENTYKDCYFGSDLLSECLKGDEEQLPLIKRRTNGSVLIKKDSKSYEYMYTNYSTNCLQGIQFNLNSNLLTNNYSIDIKKQIEYSPLKKASSILGLNKISINEQEYLQVRCIYNMHYLKINERKEVKFKDVEKCQFQDENQNYKELLDCAQSTFFEEEQFILAEGNSLFKTDDLGKTSQHRQLRNLKSNIESIDVSYHPYSLYLQMTDCIGLQDFRSNETNLILKVPTKKVPLHRIYAIKNLEENYFMTSTTQHFKIYDIRCTNYPVYSVSHGSDECPPTIINIHSTGNENQVDDDDDDVIDTLLMQDDTIKLMKQRGSEKIITSYSPHKNSDILFMRWNKGSTLLESLYESKSKNEQLQSQYTPKNISSKISATSNIFQDRDRSEEQQEEEGNNSSQSGGNDFNFKFLNTLQSQKSNVSSNHNKKEEYNFFSGKHIEEDSIQSYDQIREKKIQSTIQEDNDESDSGENDKKLQKNQILGREIKGERLCFNQEVKNLFQPKSILASTQISGTLKVRGVCTAFFDEQDKFITIQNDQKGGVAAQIFHRKNDNSPSTSSFVPLQAISSSTTSIIDLSKNDPQLNSITDLQVMKIFEQPDYTDQQTTNGDLLTEPLRKRQQKKKQVNMYPYFNYLREQVDSVKTQNLEEINKFIDTQKKKRSKSLSQQTQKSAVDNLLSSQLNTMNMAEIGSSDQIKETIMEQNNLLSVYHDKFAYPEFRKNMRYNTKNILTDKITQVLQDYWD